jgi:hypothetical protein
MQRLAGALVCAMTLIAVAAPTAVFADSPSACHSGNAHVKTVVIDGREYGPKDGLRVEVFQCEIEPGSGPVGVEWGDTPHGPGSVTPQITWGSSYAISTEWWSQLGYDGKTKAAANIFNGRRIIQVCMWYTRDGAPVSDTLCSTAASTGGSWLSGPEVTMSVWDSLDPNAPPTIFNFSKVDINP